MWLYSPTFIFVAVLSYGVSALAQSDLKQSSAHFSFVRQFSSAQDVKRDHPIIDKTLDIVAGPKDEVPVTDVLHNPRVVASDGQGRVFVLDGGSPAIHVFDFARGKYSLLQDDRMQSPAGLTADRSGNVYVTDNNSRSILIYDSRGKFSRELMKRRGEESYFEGPRGIVIHETSGLLYVCDAPRNMVIILDKRGRVLGHIGKRGGGRGPGEFRNPVQVAVTNDEVIVLDAGNSRLQIFDLQGHFRRETSVIDADAQSGLAADQDGNIYLSDGAVGQIEVSGRDGRPAFRFGETGENESQFSRPTGLSISSGCLFVVDTGNRRVQEFRIGGNSCP